jgi:AcrR family transcriptional regulator
MPRSTAGPVAVGDAQAHERPLPGVRAPRARERQIPPGNHGLTPEQVLDIQRDRLLDAFVQVVDAHGYSGAAIDVVCKHAGVSTKAFYRLFRDKEELFATTYDIGKDAVLGRAAAAYAAAGPSWRDRVRAALGSVLGTLAANPALARLCVVEANAVGPLGHDRITTSVHEAFGVFAEMEPRVPTPVPVDELVELVVGGVFTRIYLHVLERRTAELPELLDRLTYFAILPFDGPEGAARYVASTASEHAP